MFNGATYSSFIRTQVCAFGVFLTGKRIMSISFASSSYHWHARERVCCSCWIANFHSRQLYEGMNAYHADKLFGRQNCEY